MTIKKSYTTFHTITAATFNQHDETGDAVLWIGPVLFDGTVVTIAGYKVRYNGIIVTSDEIITHNTDGYRYVCLLGIDASGGSTPFSVVTNTKRGICLIEEYYGGWLTKGLAYNGNFRGLAFSRTTDGDKFWNCYGPGICADGTVVHTPIKIPWVMDQVSGTVAYPGISDMWTVDKNIPLGTITAYGCDRHLVICSETSTPVIEIRNNRLRSLDAISDEIGTCLDVMEVSDTQCMYAYSVANNLYTGTCEYGVGAIAPAAACPFLSDITQVKFVTPTTIIVILSDNTFIYGTLLGTAIDIIFSGSARWLYVDKQNGDFVHIGTDNKLYKNTVEIGSSPYFAFIHDGAIVQVTADGKILYGGKTVITESIVADIVATRTTANELFMMLQDGGGNIDMVSYDIRRAEVVYSEKGFAGTICAATFADVTTYYIDDNESTYNDAKISGGVFSDPTIEILPTLDSQWRFGKKTFNISGEHSFADFFIKSNTTGTFSAKVGTVNLGILKNYDVTENMFQPFLIGPGVSDCDYFESGSGGGIGDAGPGGGVKKYIKCLACDYNDSDKGALLTAVPWTIIPTGPCTVISGNMEVSGGGCLVMEVYAADSIVYNMNITNLQIHIAKNVLFIGCTIGSYTDHAILPDKNEYKFIGCTISGVSANSFLGLEDTPDWYYSPGAMLSVNESSDQLEFTQAARVDDGVFEFDRGDYANGIKITAYDSPSPMEIHLYTQDPTGFENTHDSWLSYNPVNRTLTLTPYVLFAIWRNGVRYEYTSPIVFPAHDNTNGTHFFYFDHSNPPVPRTSMSPWDLATTVPVSYVIYNSAATPAGFACEERHGMAMDWATHKHLHLTVGAYAASGFGLSDASCPSTTWVDEDSNRFMIDPGVVADEDLEHQNPGQPQCSNYTIMYRVDDDGDWAWVTGEYNPFMVDGGSNFIMYNEWGGTTWDLASIAHNQFVNIFVIASNSLDTTFSIVSIPGQKAFSTLTEAQDESFSSLQLGSKPFQEFVPLYRITYKAANEWVNTGKCQVAAFVRLVETGAVAISSTVAYHNALGGLSMPNAHPASSISYDKAATPFGASDVQSAVDEIAGHYETVLDFGSGTWSSEVIAYEFTERESCIIMVQIDVIGAVVADDSDLAAAGDAFHRRFTLLLKQKPGTLDLPASMILLSSDEVIFYEAASFEDARLNPGTRLDPGVDDYVAVIPSLNTSYPCVQVNAIKFDGASTESTVRYSVRFNIIDDVSYKA